jgi:hypothetical protein
MNNFIKTLIDEGRMLNDLLLKRLEEFKKPQLNKNDLLKFEDAEKCHFCNREFNKDDKKVRDHCHITGKFRGAAHQSCNLKIRTTLKIPVSSIMGVDMTLSTSLGSFTKLIETLRLFLKLKRSISLLLPELKELISNLNSKTHSNSC